MIKDGYIKFFYHLTEKECVDEMEIVELNYWRQKFYDSGLIGINSDGTGYGNISKRLGENSFLITGTNTGKYKILNSKRFVKVTGWIIDENFVECEGLCPPSSESLSHAAIYEQNLLINAIIHFHSEELWKNLRWKLPTTQVFAEYGTVDIVKEIQKIIMEDNSKSNIIILGGHEDGIIIFGESMEEAGENVYRILEEMQRLK